MDAIGVIKGQCQSLNSRIKLAIYLTLFRAVSFFFFFATEIFELASKFSKQVAK